MPPHPTSAAIAAAEALPHLAGLPPADTHLSEQLVADLLAAQHPDLAGQTVRLAGQGWDCAMFTIGQDLAARLPRRAVVAGLIHLEQTWLPRLAADLPVPVPAPVRTGASGCGYPYPWSLVPWHEGEALGAGSLAPGEAARLAAFLRALHAIPAMDLPASVVRGTALRARDSAVTPRLQRLAERFDWIADQVVPLWQQALDAPVDAAPVVLHGDLHGGNLLVDAGGKLACVLDWVDLCSGDPATDLATFWLTIDSPDERSAAIAAYPMSDATRLRARGWAVNLGAVLLDSGLDGLPASARMGEAALRRALQD
jgi:aminoglycoside phosphotransferase (APT) family kinase protein